MTTDGGGGGGESTEPALEDIPLSLDAMLDILANQRRRDLLELLQDRPENTVLFEEATKHILTEKSRQIGQQPNQDGVQVELQHHHLTKLADAGVIEYDIRSQTIRYRPDEQLEDLYDRIRDFQQERAVQ
ncbi:hypothetical protein BRC81_08705 [Halobacteriales archaeon QS_1_68_20]|nr:MAG: hypothetical protein BRC81_08705 [Halobacteriales archaeon QS_1_68_20]